MGVVSRKYGLLDIPSERKIHAHPVPRTGGLAIYVAFYLCFVPALFYKTEIIDLILQEPRILYLILGASVAFGLGLWDDIKRLHPTLKLSVQVLAALIAYAGGIRIDGISLTGASVWPLGWLSLPATVFWVIFVINAINLTDGLDGLAAGVSFFVSIILLVFCVLGERFLTAIGFAALAGATLGFLRYNFNPASIFMGDSGSYFLGYMLATLSILGSIKGQAAATMLIPVIALGLPLMDTVWSTVRRFILGQRLFGPDRDHIHHRLLKLGLTQRRTVLVLYGITIVLGLVSIIFIHARDERAALLLLLVGVTMIFGIRKLGYLSYLSVGRMIRWVGDVSDELGINQDRRRFLGCQIEISQSTDMDEFWLKVVSAVQLMELDYLELKLEPKVYTSRASKTYHWNSGKRKMKLSSLDPNKTMYTSLPLEDGNDKFGALILAKKIDASSEHSNHTLQRIEHLRRTVTETLHKLANMN